jgi:hypothetical protein
MSDTSNAPRPALDLGGWLAPAGDDPKQRLGVFPFYAPMSRAFVLTPDAVVLGKYGLDVPEGDPLWREARPDPWPGLQERRSGLSMDHLRWRFAVGQGCDARFAAPQSQARH